ncbi:uncharacterized protein LAESUDRAFT_710329 [Laetiporus sulphureus 93-53]|uniref:Uncharacterized protein n=1 Tax=Laetiporus sulphureus 93-53 TaxID=1314785 RepID=A0A165HHR5_9APHY|nr:uncharacterized protein LAESUDRAFT_710329 [Laetiporus sulphureus 93-53]KZT11748.1 hypothetical protein LAESUDRAFT_710329 [Laetiporus sulphureus 93-53]
MSKPPLAYHDLLTGQNFFLYWNIAMATRRLTLGTAIILVNRYTLLSLAIILLFDTTSPHTQHISVDVRTIPEFTLVIMHSNICSASYLFLYWKQRKDCGILLSFEVSYISMVPVCAAIQHGSTVKINICKKLPYVMSHTLAGLIFWNSKRVRGMGTTIPVRMLLLRNDDREHNSVRENMDLVCLNFFTFIEMVVSILTTQFLFDLRQNVNSTNVLQNNVTTTDSHIIGDFVANLELNISNGGASVLSLDDDAVDDSDSPTATEGENITADLEEGSERDPEVEEVH